MRKFKPVALHLATKLYWEGDQVAKVFHFHHTNLMFRFKRFGIPIKSKSVAMKNNPLCARKKPYNWKGGYTIDVKGYLVNNQSKIRRHREIAESILGRKLKSYEVVHH